MSDLSIELKPLRQRVLVQESLPVTTSLVNRGTSATPAPAANGPSPFAYELRPTAGGEGTRVVSSQLAREATSKGTPQLQPPLPFQIGPGASVPRREDLAAIAVRPFAPASYAITASTEIPYPLGPSAPASVQVVPPRLVVAAAAVDSSFDRPMAFVHAEADGAFPVLAHYSDASKVEATVFQRAATQERWPKPDSIAVSVPTGAEAQTRWVAWTAGGTLRATRDWEPSRTPALLHITLPGAGARLLSPGYFFGDDSGLFLLLDGAVLHAYRVTGTAIAKAWSATVGGGTPERVLVRYAGGDRGEGAVQVVSLSGAGGRHSLFLQAWNVKDGREVLPSRLLSQLAFPLLAWYMPVAGKARPVRLQVVSGPAPDGRFASLAYQLEKNTVRIPTQPIPPPPGTVQQWAVTAAGNGMVIVAAHSGGKILSLTLPGAAWRTLADNVSAESFFDVYANFDRARVQWLDPRFGFRYAGLGAQ